LVFTLSEIKRGIAPQILISLNIWRVHFGSGKNGMNCNINFRFCILVCNENSGTPLSFIFKLKDIYMLSFKFSFKLNAKEYAATATPFEKDGGISYDISIPDKIFTIKAMPLKDGGVVWVDYYSAEPTELSQAAGRAIQSIKN
jgi:hypothetical protein